MHDHALLVPAGGHDPGTPACPHRLVDVGLDLRQPLVEPVHARPVRGIAHARKAGAGGIAFDPVDVEARRGEDLSAQFQPGRSEEHTSELQSLMRSSYAVFCLKKKTTN